MSPAEMPAGRELDALVAVKVMGWKGESGYRGRSWTRPKPADARSRNACYVHLPHFSTEIAAAWTVVDAMADKGWSFDTRYDPEPWVGNIARAIFTAVNVGIDHPDHLRRASADAETAPLAICRAALAASAPELVPVDSLAAVREAETECHAEEATQ